MSKCGVASYWKVWGRPMGKLYCVELRHQYRQWQGAFDSFNDSTVDNMV